MGGLVDPPLTFAPVPGTYYRTGVRNASYTINATKPVVWTWTTTGDLPTANVANGGTAMSITFSLSGPAASTRSCSIALQAGGNTWLINLDTTGTGGTS